MYQIGQAVITNDKLWFITHISGTGDMFFLQNMAGQYLLVSELTTCPATEAEILAEAAKHGWKQSNSKWLYTSPSGQLELMDNDGWTPVIKRQPLSDQFAIFGNECIVADRLITALKLTK